MKFILPLANEGLVSFLRRTGYAPFRDTAAGTVSFVRRLGVGEYPRFHLYSETKAGSVPALADGGVVLNLHLDQKRPSYGGSHAHAGEYEGPLVSQEKERILHAAA